MSLKSTSCFFRSVVPVLVLAGVAQAAGAAERAEPPSWVKPMKQVHARFTGKPGTLALFGDSITVSLAFWAPLQYEPKNMPPDMVQALGVVKGFMRPECWDKWRGPQHGNEGSTTIRWARDHVDQWLKDLNPEAAVIMFGTNDLGQVPPKEFEQKTTEVVDRCLKNGTVVLLTTLPPRSGQEKGFRRLAEIVRRIAREKQVPLIDFQAECLKRRPRDWDGTLPQFKNVAGDEYQVPTLISRDGVHPSNPAAHQDYSEEGLRCNGFALRSYLTLKCYAEVVRQVLAPSKKEAP